MGLGLSEKENNILSSLLHTSILSYQLKAPIYKQQWIILYNREGTMKGSEDLHKTIYLPPSLSMLSQPIRFDTYVVYP